MSEAIAFLRSINWSWIAGIVVAVLTFALNQDMHPQVVLSPIVNFVLMALIIAIAAAQGRKP